MKGYYDYQELENNAMNRGTQEDLNALGEWFERFGSKFWNGESYKINSSYNLYPIYQEIDEDNFEIIGYEIR